MLAEAMHVTPALLLPIRQNDPNEGSNEIKIFFFRRLFAVLVRAGVTFVSAWYTAVNMTTCIV